MFDLDSLRGLLGGDTVCSTDNPSKKTAQKVHNWLRRFVDIGFVGILRRESQRGGEFECEKEMFLRHLALFCVAASCTPFGHCTHA